MIQYWVPLALLTVVAMLFVLVPLWRLRARESVHQLHVREEKNRDIFAERQQELEKEMRDGTIAPEDYQRLVAELQRAFLSDMQGLQSLEATRPQRSITLLWVPLALALLIPVAAALLYHIKGSGPDLQLPALMREAREAQDKDSQAAALDKLTALLAERMQRKPRDMQNNYMLGTLYMGLEHYDKAVGVFKQMLDNMESGPDKATVLGQLAQTYFLQASNTITPEVRSAMEEALTFNPNEQGVMALYGVDAYLKQDFVTAVKYWRRQLADMQPGSADAQQLQERIAAVESNLPEDQKAAAQGARIPVVIDISPELASQVTPDMRLFVFARNPAMRMPIVAKDFAMPSFPFTITLDNSMSMTGMQLESAPQLVVGARLSRIANAQSGDLQTLSAPFELQNQKGTLTLVIDSIAP